ncbi:MULTISPECIES: hypothetical protein [unclassified Microbacterium]|uniref:hypothetical protein n=1 Tax=unclassified Microbacterium TaxID=2609290 RepID=UPI003017993F
MTSPQDLAARARAFADRWRDNPQNGDTIYALYFMEGEGAERHEESVEVSASLLDDMADAIEAAYRMGYSDGFKDGRKVQEASA